MPIKIHELLYFKRASTQTTYSDIPNDNLNISRLLAGQKPFPSTQTTEQSLKKTIIVDCRIRDPMIKKNTGRPHQATAKPGLFSLLLSFKSTGTL